MEKINVAELLKDCPSGMELDCTMYDNVTFEEVITVRGSDDKIRVKITLSTHYSDGMKDKINLTEFGTYTDDETAKCVIFPKGKTSWEGFVPPYKFKSGDIVYTIMDGIAILGDRIEEYSEGFRSHCSLFNCGFDINIIVSPQRLATKEEKQKLFQAIKDYGYKWNEETKTLEKLIELKEDTNDEVVVAGIYFNREHYSDEVELHLGNYGIEVRDGKTYAIFKNKETKESKPKFKVGDRVRHKNDKTIIAITGIKDDYYFVRFYNIKKCDYQNEKVLFKDQDKYELASHKFDINTLVPFESRVLMRSSNAREWTGTIFSHYSNNKFYGCGMCCDQCIPYEGNEHLLGKTDDCDIFYKTWE